jgi:inward rectifier potassium channel
MTRLVRNDGRIDATILGIRRHPLHDVYFGLLQASWSRLLLSVVVTYVTLNALFALIYLVTGGIEGARPGSFADAFFFSVQTMATIGYGVMHPKTPLANVLVTVEALIGLLGLAIISGVMFAKFSRPSGQLLFSKVAVISMREGVPCLMFRVANERTNHVAEATMRVAVVRNERTRDGEAIRRWYDIPLQRAHSPVFALSWTVIHTIDEQSLFRGATPESLAADQSELIVNLTGLDSTLATTIFGRHGYIAEEIAFGAKFADIIGIDDEGKRVVDFRRFHDTVPSPLPQGALDRSRSADHVAAAE